MKNLYTHQTSNIRKTWLLMVSFLGVVIAIGYVFSVVYQEPLILYFAVGYSFVANIVSYWWSDKIVLGVTGAKEASRKEHFDLYTTVENLAITAGLPMPKVYIVNDDAPNAFATGRDKDHAVVAVTTGLLSILEKNELEGVLAHELSHIGNRDILISTVAVTLVGVIALLADIFLRHTLFYGGGRRGNDKAGGVMLLIGIALAILSPIIASLLQLAISRKREFLADASGALLTRYPEGLANALRKINASAQPLKKANHATAHLFISNPFGAKGQRKFLTKIFQTHPPAEDRIKALLSRS